MNIRDKTNEKIIVNISEAEWFQTLDFCPMTLNQLKLFISITDKMKILNSYDINLMLTMDSKRLNLIFAVLKVTDKFIISYSEQLIKKILKPYYIELFNIDKHGMVMDQLIQDTEPLIMNYITTNFPEIHNDHLDIALEFTKIIDNKFYKKAKLQNLDINNSNTKIRKTYDKFLERIIIYTTKSMRDIYDTMHKFMMEIFDDDTTDERINDLIYIIVNDMHFEQIQNDSFSDIDIYYEYYCNDDYNAMTIAFHPVLSDIQQISH